ncbi:MAG: mycofactocin radical SAM maturase [Gaiellales bacterium]|nr:mycofactocin radical SAM maturase [Gaiellales bacterium]
MPAKGVETTSYLRAPVNVTWEITNRCDLHCRHCLSAELRARGGPELDLAQCEAVLDHLAEVGVFQLNFGGGEPFLRPDFPTILTLARSRGFTSCVSTNGLALTPSVVDELVQIQPVYLQVSLDGATARTNDAIRGAGSFERIMAAIRLLSQRSYPDFSINTVVTRANFMDIPDLLRLAEDYGARSRLSRFRPSGGARECWEELRLSRDLMERLSELLSARPDIKTGDSFFAISADDRRHLGLNMCGAAKMTCSIAPDGSIYPCAFLTEARFLAGHVLDDGSLQRAWRSAPVLGELRERDINSCRACSRFSLCHGGCPAVAYFMTSELGYADPECLQPAASRPATPRAT